MKVLLLKAAGEITLVIEQLCDPVFKAMAFFLVDITGIFTVAAFVNRFQIMGGKALFREKLLLFPAQRLQGSG